MFSTNRLLVWIVLAALLLGSGVFIFRGDHSPRKSPPVLNDLSAPLQGNAPANPPPVPLAGAKTNGVSESTHDSHPITAENIAKTKDDSPGDVKDEVEEKGLEAEKGDTRKDPLSKFPIIDQEIQDLGNDRKKIVSLYDTGDRVFPLIRREDVTGPDGKGGITKVCQKEVSADHFVLTAASMEERKQIEADLARAGIKCTHKAPTEPWMLVHVSGKSFKALAESRVALERLLPASARLTEDGVSWPAIAPNDTSYSYLYGMTKIQANRAWDIADAAGDVLIGVVDTGVDYTHPDLAANIWSNKLEIPGNGIDDDGNGYIDDFCGYDFYYSDNNPADGHSHGTHVAGTAAAVGFNSLGVIGVAPRAKIVACKFMSDAGSGLDSAQRLAQAYLLALRQRGEFVAAVNLSIGRDYAPYVMGGVDDQTAFDNGIVDCFAAGNDGFDMPGNIIGTNYTPYILYVANTDSSDNLVSSSNRGYDWCDLSGPGSVIKSTTPNSGYANMTGTSMATPHVAGAVAMVAAVNRSLTAVQVMSVITGSVDRIAAVQNCTMSQGRLNVYKAVQLASTYPDVALISPSQNGTLAKNQTVTLVASVKITSNTVTAVRFYRGGTTLIGTDNSAAGGWTCPWTPSATGTYDLTCEADDNAGHTTRTWWRTRVTVANSAPAPVASVIATDNFGSELGDHAKFVVQLSSPSASDLTLPLVVSGTATAGSDYTALPASLVITAGTLCAEVPVLVLNDFNEEVTETVIVTVGSGTGYTVGSASNATAWIHDDESEAPAIILADPTNVMASVGASAAFSVSAGGKAPLFYQWRKNSTNIPSATAGAYTIASVVPSDVGLYSCTVSNLFGVAASAGAALVLAEVSPVPASDIQPNSAKLNAYLSLSNNTVDVYVYWNTVDGGTNAALWTNSAYVGTWTTAASAIFHNATGLTPDKTYYFTFACSNASGRAWASRVLSFGTMGSVAVDNIAGVTNTVIGVSTLRGALTAGSVGDIYYYWGASDGGMDPGAWANVVVQSNVPQGSFSATISNLLYGLPYYYRCFASNSIGTAWSTGSTSFTTIYRYFSENFDGVAAPSLPAGWTTEGTAAAAWKTHTPTNDTAPNAAYAPDLTSASSNALISPVFLYVTNMGSLIFRHAYYFEGTTTAYDGGVLDVKIGSNPWQDIITAGGSWVGNGYTKTLSTAYQNPLGGRSAWGADSAFITTTVNLPAGAAGQQVQLRWMIASDSSGGDIGWFVDTIRFTASGGKLQLAPAAATSVTESSATLNGALSCSGAVMAVYAHWGAVNGGTNVSSWENTAYVGSWTNVGSASFSKMVTGLSPFGTYYFTCRGSNACEQLWATNVLSFMTLGTPVFPVVDNGQGPTDATVSGCRLNGLLSDGGLAEAWLCWGDNDAGMLSTGEWDHVVSVGTVYEGVPFGAAVSGLSTNTTYWYRCFVANVSGSDWSDSATAFSAVPYSHLWTPAQLSTIAWYDAADAGTIIASNGTVSQWNDKSGNNRHATQGTVANRPAFQASDSMVNDLPSIGNSATNGLIGLNTPSFSAKNIYVVTYYKDGLDSSFDGYPTLFSGPGTYGMYRVMGNVNTAGFIGTSSFNDAGTFRNGSDVSSTTVLPMPASILKLKSSAARTQVYSLGFNTVDATRDWQGSYSEWIFTAGAEDAATQQKIEGYLAWKWSLYGSLPAGHPYKNNPPSVGAYAIRNLAPAALVDSAGVLNAALSASGAEYDIRVYWGTTDETTNLTWASSAYVGSWTNVASTNISYQVTGLSAGTTYYCTFRATNAGTNVWATPSWQFMTTGTSGGSSNYSLGVVSAHGGASPGSSIAPSGTVFNCSITNSPVTNGTTQYFCTGWAMTGNGPFSGTATNFVMTLTNNATLTWQWKTNYWIELNVAGN